MRAVLKKLRADAASIARQAAGSENEMLEMTANPSAAIAKSAIQPLLKSYGKKTASEKNQALMNIIDKVVANKTRSGYAFEIFYK